MTQIQLFLTLYFEKNNGLDSSSFQRCLSTEVNNLFVEAHSSINVKTKDCFLVLKVVIFLVRFDKYTLFKCCSEMFEQEKCTARLSSRCLKLVQSKPFRLKSIRLKNIQKYIWILWSEESNRSQKSWIKRIRLMVFKKSFGQCLVL